jgi:hypothetical protein
VLTSLQVLLRLATLRWLGVFICALAPLLAAANTASALEPAQTKTRIWGFDFAKHNSGGLFRAASSGKHQGNRLAEAAEASGSLLAARGGAQSAANAARLRAQLAADHILNAQRVGSGLKADAAHRSASFLSRAELEAGQVFGIRGGDGVQRTLLQTQGGVNGQKGIFEFIIDSGGAISHQRFIPGGAITGFPNQVVTRLP